MIDVTAIHHALGTGIVTEFSRRGTLRASYITRSLPPSPACFGRFGQMK